MVLLRNCYCFCEIFCLHLDEGASASSCALPLAPSVSPSHTGMQIDASILTGLRRSTIAPDAVRQLAIKYATYRANYVLLQQLLPPLK